MQFVCFLFAQSSVLIDQPFLAMDPVAAKVEEILRIQPQLSSRELKSRCTQLICLNNLSSLLRLVVENSELRLSVFLLGILSRADFEQFPLSRSICHSACNNTNAIVLYLIAAAFFNSRADLQHHFQLKIGKLFEGHKWRRDNHPTEFTNAVFLSCFGNPYALQFLTQSLEVDGLKNVELTRPMVKFQGVECLFQWILSSLPENFAIIFSIPLAQWSQIIKFSQESAVKAILLIISQYRFTEHIKSINYLLLFVNRVRTLNLCCSEADVKGNIVNYVNSSESIKMIFISRAIVCEDWASSEECLLNVSEKWTFVSIMCLMAQWDRRRSALVNEKMIFFSDANKMDSIYRFHCANVYCRLVNLKKAEMTEATFNIVLDSFYEGVLYNFKVEELEVALMGAVGVFVEFADDPYLLDALSFCRRGESEARHHLLSISEDIEQKRYCLAFRRCCFILPEQRKKLEAPIKELYFQYKSRNYRFQN